MTGDLSYGSADVLCSKIYGFTESVPLVTNQSL
jgi:hypothetical protein